MKMEFENKILAFVYDKYGDIENFKFEKVDKPIPSSNEILIKIFAVSLNDWDIGLLQGKPFANRLISGIFTPKYKILGSDIAGVVEAIGDSVKNIKVGDRVFGDLSNDGWGGFSEYTCCKEDSVSVMPDSMTFEQAAAFPQASQLMIQGLKDEMESLNGKKLLINGAGGGVGTLGIQFACMLGVAEITGVDSSEKLDMMKKMGFDYVIDYKEHDFVKGEKKYDFILDAVMQKSPFSYLRVLEKNGVYVPVGGKSLYLIMLMISKWFLKVIFQKNFRMVMLKQNKDLNYVSELFEKEDLEVVIDKIFPFEKIYEAAKYYYEGHQKGKIVVRIR